MIRSNVNILSRLKNIHSLRISTEFTMSSEKVAGKAVSENTTGSDVGSAEMPADLAAASLEEAKKKYEFFWKSQSPFSQWHICSFVVKDTTFNCAEQYMMYKKAELFGDLEIAAQVLKAESPKVQKSLGRKVKNWDDDTWNENCHTIVEEGNEAKFSQNDKLKKILFDTYPKTLVEASPVDTIWGIGYAAENWQAWDERWWRGTNFLGKALTKVRNKLMKAEGLIKDDTKE